MDLFLSSLDLKTKVGIHTRLAYLLDSSLSPLGTTNHFQGQTTLIPLGSEFPGRWAGFRTGKYEQLGLWFRLIAKLEEYCFDFLSSLEQVKGIFPGQLSWRYYFSFKAG